MKINHINHHNIDLDAYTKCIEKSEQKRIYALPWFLDIVSPNWSLLMADDYAYVMPLPTKKKFLLFPYIQQPSICHQLGIFSTKKLSEEIFAEFINAIPYKNHEIRFNSDNKFNYTKAGVCTNYIMNLNLPYSSIKSKYSHKKLSCVDSVRQAKIIFETTTNYEMYSEFITSNSISKRNLNSVKLLDPILKEAQKRGLFELWIAKSDNNIPLASVCILKYGNRFYYTTPAASSKGQKENALILLIDHFIKSYSGQNAILDFVASSSPTSAHFIEGFGAIFESYLRIYRRSKLPI